MLLIEKLRNDVDNLSQSVAAAERKKRIRSKIKYIEMNAQKLTLKFKVKIIEN